jgi:hypothetical protein
MVNPGWLHKHASTLENKKGFATRTPSIHPMVMAGTLIYISLFIISNVFHS